MPDVVVIGAGPVGTLLAGELARRGVDVGLYERRPAAGGGTRAIGVHAPVLSALESSGVTERLLAVAARVPRGEARSAGRSLGSVSFARLSTRFPFVATLPQAATEAVLAAGAPEPTRGATAMAVTPRPDGVRVSIGIGGRPTELTAPIVVVATGAGGRDLVFRPGAVRAHEYRDRYLMADAATGARDDDDLAVIHLDGRGVLESFPLPGLAPLRHMGPAGRRPRSRGPDHAPARRTRCARRGRGIRRHLRGDRLRRSQLRRAEAAQRPRARDRRRRARGEPDRRAGHEPRPARRRDPRAAPRDLGAHGEAPDAELARWEARRVASARTAARLAAANTALGRSAPRAVDAGRRALVRAMLTAPVDRVFARAYAMGFDADA
nr:hypothetical protein GCM10025699_10780 [Microbacterium flavescens]